MPTKLILIRHGETLANRNRRFVGHTNPALTVRGSRQAKTIKNRLRNIKIHEIYCSDRLRASQTAKIAFSGLPIKICPAFKEMHFGIFEGKTHDQLLKSHNKTYEAWLKSPFKFPIPKGESFKNFKKRVLVMLKNILSKHHNKTTAIVTHAGPIFIIVSKFTESKQFLKKIPELTSIHLIEINRKKIKISALNHNLPHKTREKR